MSGKKTVAMTELKKVFADCGFSDVSTCINSGNVVFRSKMNSIARLKKPVELKIKKKFGFEVKTVILELAELERILSRCPFRENDLKAGEKIYFTILSGVPDRKLVSKLEGFERGTDEFIVMGNVIYLLVKNGYSRTVLNNGLIEKVLNTDGTTRNINTLKKIAEIGLGLN